jgi:hypothetical protein
VLATCRFYLSATLVNHNFSSGFAFRYSPASRLTLRIVLAAASGQSEQAMATQLAVNRRTMRLWRQRFAQQGLQSLWEIASDRGRKLSYGPEKIQEIIDATLQSKPKGQTQWSCRLLAPSVWGSANRRQTTSGGVTI